MDNPWVEIQFLDVGQGDSTLIVCPEGETILIDMGSINNAQVAAGDAIKYLVGKLTELKTARKLTKPTLDYVFLTHPDEDHYNQLPLLCKAFKGTLDIQNIYIGGQQGNYQENGIQPTVLVPAAKVGRLYDFEKRQRYKGGTSGVWTFSSGKVKLYLLCVNARGYNLKYKNDMSIVLKLTYAGRSALFMGDAGKYSEKLILDWYGTSGVLRSDVLKLGHHGSAASSITEWIQAVKPTMAFATADMTWAHPYCATIKRVSDEGYLWALVDHYWLCGEGRWSKKEYYNHFTDCGVYTNIAYQIQMDEKVMRESEKALNKIINKKFNPKNDKTNDGLVVGGQYALKIHAPGTGQTQGKFELDWVIPGASGGLKPFASGTAKECAEIVPPPDVSNPMELVLSSSGCC